MKSNLLSVAIAFTAMFSFFNAGAQETKSILQNEKQIVYKITGFTAETNKKIRNEFNADKHFKIVYTCEQTGMVVVEFKENLTISGKEEIESRLLKITEAGKFVQEPNCTMKDAENKCILQSQKKQY